MKEKSYQLYMNMPPQEDKIKYYCAFNYLFIRPLLKSKIFDFFCNDIIRAFHFNEVDLAQIKEIYDINIPKDIIKKRDKIDVDKCFEEAFSDEEIKIITYEDEKYPPLLREIPDFPLSLFYKGDLNNVDYKYNLAVVGSRNATQESKIALNNIISGFKNSNLTIVSGLAYGIDTQAHLSAILNNLKTIAVVGCGLDIIYPSSNKKLFEDIKNGSGVIFSEYPLKIRPMSQNFPQRNRIVTGMSKGTLVAEARLKSGAMISANLTLDYNRELMCMPGNILNPNTEGIYHLIKQGAGMVIEPKDLLHHMDWELNIEDSFGCYLELTDSQKKVYDIMSYEAKTFDELVNETKEEVPLLMVTLTELEIKGLIKQSNNKYYKLQ